MGLGPLRVEIHRAPIGRERSLDAAGGLEHVAEVVVRARVPVVESHCPLQE